MRGVLFCLLAGEILKNEQISSFTVYTNSVASQNYAAEYFVSTVTLDFPAHVLSTINFVGFVKPKISSDIYIYIGYSIQIQAEIIIIIIIFAN